MSSILGPMQLVEQSTNERPFSWRRGILLLNPNGDAPLTAITSVAEEKKVEDPEFNWFTKKLPTRTADITGAYTNASLGTAKTGTGTAEEEVYFKMAEADVQHFREGQLVHAVDEDSQTRRAVAKVIELDKNGASSYVKVRLKAAASTAATFENVDYLEVFSNANPVGSTRPDGLSYEATKYTGYTQIVRTPMKIPRTVKQISNWRTGPKYDEMKRESLMLHGLDLDGMGLWGTATEENVDSEDYEYTSQGIFEFLMTNASDNVIDYPSGTSSTWAAGGEDWLDESLEQIFRYGSQERMALCGSGALLGIQKLVKAAGNFEIKDRSLAYGFKVLEWVTPFGSLMLKGAPTFSHTALHRNSVCIFDPKNIKFNYLQDTKFTEVDGANTETGYDGTVGEWLTEAGFELHFPDTFGFLTGVGDDGTVGE